MADEVFWGSTPREVNALLDRIGERDEARERAAALRAALIASEVYNTNRADHRGRPLRYPRRTREPEDYLNQPVRHIDGEMMRDLVHSWMGPPKETTQ